MYRICYRSLLTGHRGCGSFVFPNKSVADDVAEDLNLQFIGSYVHWSEKDQN